MEKLANYQGFAHNAFRIVVGFAFFTHGADKLFTWFGREESVELMSRWGAAGVIETVGGLLILIGFKTRWAAFIASGEMAVAYFWMHAYRGETLWFWENRGELVMLFSFAFLLLATMGAGTLSLDAKLARGLRALPPTPNP